MEQLSAKHNEECFPFMGKKVIVMSSDDKIYYGKLIYKYNDEILLEDVIYLVSHTTRHKNSHGQTSYHEITASGVNDKGHIFYQRIDCICLFRIREIIPCTEEAIECMENLDD